MEEDKKPLAEQKRDLKEERLWNAPISSIFLVLKSVAVSLLIPQSASIILYVREELMMSENFSQSFYFYVEAAIPYFVLAGFYFSDFKFGRWRLILCGLLFETIASSLMLASTLTSDVTTSRILFFQSLFPFLLAIGATTPVVVPLFGDQFVLPADATIYRNMLYFLYYGHNLSTLVKCVYFPILRKDVRCFQKASCYPLILGLNMLACLVNIGFYMFMYPCLKLYKPTEPIFKQFLSCIWYALRQTRGNRDKVDHWIDRSLDKYPEQLVQDIKQIFRFLMIMLCFPIYFALYLQLQTRWILEATYHNRVIWIKNYKYVIKQDQMLAINTFLVLILGPMFQLYHCRLRKCCLFGTDISRVALGSAIVAGSFAYSGYNMWQVERTWRQSPKDGYTHVNFINTLNCTLTVVAGKVITLKPMSNYIVENIPSGHLKITVNHLKCLELKKSEEVSTTLRLRSGNNVGMILHAEGSGDLSFEEIKDNIEHTPNADPKLRFIYKSLRMNQSLSWVVEDSWGVRKEFVTRTSAGKIGITDFGSHDVDTVKLQTRQNSSQALATVLTYELRHGGVYDMFLYQTEEGGWENKEFVLMPPASRHIAWMLPQYVILTVGEIIHNVAYNELLYTEAPVRMKSMIFALNSVFSSFGAIAVGSFIECQVFSRLSIESLVFSIILLLDSALLAKLGQYYRRRSLDEDVTQRKELFERK